MARMIPPQFHDINRSAAEARVFAALARLPDEVVVFHSRRWHDRSGSRVEEGEADFVIVDPDAGVLVAEVKGGAIEQRDGAWFQGERGQAATDWIDPAGQARKSMHVLRRALGARLDVRSVLFGQLVWFPDLAWTEDTPLDSPPVLDLSDLDNPAAAIASVFAYWKKGRRAQGGGGARTTAALIELLAPTMRLDPTPIEPLSVAPISASPQVPVLATPTSRPADRFATLKAHGATALAMLGKLALEALRALVMLPVSFVMLVLGLVAGMLLEIGKAGWRGWKALVHFTLGAGLIGAAVSLLAYFGFHAERGPAWIASFVGLAFVAFVLSTLNQGLETHAARLRNMRASRMASRQA